MAAVKMNPQYADFTAADRERLYERYRETANQERMLQTRGTLGISEATINLNTCAEDALEAIPKLSKQIRKSILHKRNNLPNQRFSSWDEVSTITGIGPTILTQMKVFCILMVRELYWLYGCTSDWIYHGFVLCRDRRLGLIILSE